MRGILPSQDMTQPYCIVVVYDKATDTPSFALTNYGIGQLDSDTVLFGGMRIPLVAKVNDLKFKEMRPSGLGSGLHRRECSFSIVNGSPFALAPFSAGLYSAGATTDSFYFSLWVNDFSKSVEDMYVSGMCLGYFDLDAGIGWDETSLITTIKLVERLTNLTGRYNQITEAAENLLAGSEWQRLLDQPAYLGYRPKVQAIGRVAGAIGGFDSYNKGVLGVIAGIVQSSTLSGTSIQLGKSPALASLVGTTVKLKMGNGCIISGAITDLTGGDYGINTTGMSVGVAWDNLLIYNKGWTAANDALLPAKNTDLSSIFIDNSMDLTRLPSTNMYLKSSGNVVLYNGGPVTTANPLFCRLTGIKDEANKELSCVLLKDPANTNYKYGGLSVSFDSSTHTTLWPAGDNVHLNFAKWLGKQTCGLYFTDRTYVLADIQVQGMPWELIITPYVNTAATTTLTFDYIIRLAGSTVIAEDSTGNHAIYADDGKSLTVIPNTEIASITYNSNAFGLADACKITLNRRLTAINPAYDENFLYIDTSKPMYAGEVISFIMDNASININLRDYTLRTGTNKIGNPMGLSIKSETWSQLLDVVVFEGGVQVDVKSGFYVLHTSFDKGNIYTFNCGADSAQTFCYVDTNSVVNFGDIIDGTYKMDMGRLFTNIDSDGREFVRTWYKFQYVYSNYGGAKLRTLQSIKAAKNNDRVVDYTFKCLIDTASATAAAGQMMRIGHAANIPDVTRTITVGLPFSYLNLQVLDTVRLQDFRHITRINDPLPKYNDSSTTNPVYSIGTWGPTLKYTTSTPYALIPGVGIVDTLEFNFSGSGVPIMFTFKQVQARTTNNLKSVADYSTINTSADNIAATSTNQASGGTPNIPGAQYQCPDSNAIQKVVISSGEVKPSGVTISDPCCNTTSSSGDIASDPQIVVLCAGGCTGPKGCVTDNFPNGCVDFSRIWYEPRTDTTIGSTDTLIFDIYSFGDKCPALVELNYEGKTTPDTCVSYANTCISGNARIGVLSVSPCVFNFPEGSYNKTITLKFTVSYCTSSMPPATNQDGSINTNRIWAPRVNEYKTKTIGIAIPIDLRPVSDISI